MRKRKADELHQVSVSGVDAEFHRRFAVDLFQFVWSLLEREERSPEETDAMINAAHASRFHWAQLGGPMHVAYSEWQISRVYAVLGRPEAALYHAGRCLAICQQDSGGEFAEAYAYEALSRAYALAGDSAKAQEFFDEARRSGSRIESLADREMLARDLLTIPGVDAEAPDGEPDQASISIDEPSPPAKRTRRGRRGRKRSEDAPAPATVEGAPENPPAPPSQPAAAGQPKPRRTRRRRGGQSSSEESRQQTQ